MKWGAGADIQMSRPEKDLKCRGAPLGDTQKSTPI